MADRTATKPPFYEPLPVVIRASLGERKGWVLDLATPVAHHFCVRGLQAIQLPGGWKARAMSGGRRTIHGRGQLPTPSQVWELLSEARSKSARKGIKKALATRKKNRLARLKEQKNAR